MKKDFIVRYKTEYSNGKLKMSADSKSQVQVILGQLSLFSSTATIQSIEEEVIYKSTRYGDLT